MKETSKSMARRLRDNRFIARYFSGNGIDIGAGQDPIWIYREWFPLMKEVKDWDIKDGDAQVLPGIATGFYDFVHSSHCLEHMVDPRIALHRWFDVLKPGGHLICLIPDEDLYEQGVFPSTYNSDHKWTFTIYKRTSWSSRTINIFELIAGLGDACACLKVELLDATHQYELPRFDQTLTPLGESAIEFILRKRLPDELQQKGRLPKTDKQITKRGFEILAGLKLS